MQMIVEDFRDEHVIQDQSPKRKNVDSFCWRRHNNDNNLQDRVPEFKMHLSLIFHLIILLSICESCVLWKQSLCHLILHRNHVCYTKLVRNSTNINKLAADTKI